MGSKTTNGYKIVSFDSDKVDELCGGGEFFLQYLCSHVEMSFV